MRSRRGGGLGQPVTPRRRRRHCRGKWSGGAGALSAARDCVWTAARRQEGETTSPARTYRRRDTLLARCPRTRRARRRRCAIRKVMGPVHPRCPSGARAAPPADRIAASHHSRRSALLSRRLAGPRAVRPSRQWLHPRDVSRLLPAQGCTRCQRSDPGACESDPAEVEALHGYAARRSPWTPGARCSLAWASARPRIAITEETGASLRRIHLGLRVSHHASNGVRAATLKEFAEARDRLPAEVVEGHAPRGDFSRWIREVFGDYQLALEVHALETRSREESDAGAVAAIGSVIRGRYDLAADDEMHGGAANA